MLFAEEGITFNYELNLSCVEPIMLCAYVRRQLVEDVPRGVHMNFLKAERSLHRWALEDFRRIHAAEEVAAEEGGGVEMHVLEDAGHWVCYVIQFFFLYNDLLPYVSLSPSEIYAIVQKILSTLIPMAFGLFGTPFKRGLIYFVYEQVHADNPDGLFRILSSSFQGGKT